MKKILYGTIGAAAVTLMMQVEHADASTYQVKPNDSLWKIASLTNNSVQQLIEWNGIKNSTIYPGQLLTVEKKAVNNSSTEPKASTEATNSIKTVSYYTVKAGDSLSKIAHQNGIRLETLMKQNKLTTSLIFVGQQLQLGKSDSPSKEVSKNQPKQETAKPLAQPSSISTSYLVKAGDSLSKIALETQVTVQQLKEWNQLKTDTVFVGQKLILQATNVIQKPTVPVKPVVPTKPVLNPTDSISKETITEIATSLLGTPYKWGGATLEGFDCSGFIYYVYKNAGLSLSRLNSKGYDARSYEVTEPQVGDLVFFANTYTTGISHVGIYSGDGKFIHADSKGISVSSVEEKYWSEHFDSFKRFYDMD